MSNGETTRFYRRVRHWKTTGGGIIMAAGIALRKVPSLAPYADAVEGFGALLLATSAADARNVNKFEEVRPVPPVPPVPTP